jgi:hypothetical protein
MELIPRTSYSRFLVFMILLVVGLRVWAEYDQAAVYKCCLIAVQPLFHHAPADALRFVFNFPASLISWFLLPAPPYVPWKGTLSFAAREAESVLLEIALTLMFWLGVGRLVRRGRLDLFKKVPLKIALPVFFLLAAVTLDKVGAMQYSRLVAKVHPYELLDGFWSRDSFAGYALNAPAWVATRILESGIEGSDDAWALYLRWSNWLVNFKSFYFLCVAVLWVLVGAHLDQQRRSKNIAMTWKGRGLWLLCAFTGLILYVTAGDSYYGYPGEEPWFAVAVLAWGTLLTLASVYFLCQDATRIWGSATRILCSVYGVLAACLGILVYAFPLYEIRFRGSWFAFVMMACSLTAFIESFYWLLRGPKQRQVQPQTAAG